MTETQERGVETNFSRLASNYPKIEEWFQQLPVELVRLAEIIKKRLKAKDKDFVCCISSDNQGDGKSTLGIILCFLLDVIGFDLIDNIAYLPDSNQIKIQFNSIGRYSGLLIDEGRKALTKRKWQHADVQEIETMLITERFQNKAVFSCMPRLTDHTEEIRNHTIVMHIKVVKRGWAVVHIRDNSDNSDPWWIAWADKWGKKHWRGKHIADISIEDRMKLEKMKRTYLMDFRFPALPPPIEKVYKALKEESRKESNKEEENVVDVKVKDAQQKLFYAISIIKSLKPKYTKTALASDLKISKETLKKLLTEFDPKDDLFTKKTPEQLVSEGVLPGFMGKEESEGSEVDIDSEVID